MDIYKYTTDDAIKEALDHGPGKAASDGLKLAQTFIVDKEDIIPLVTGEDANTDSAMITTQAKDRDDDIVVSEGGDLTNFIKNPIVLFGHNSRSESAVMGRSITQEIVPGTGIRATWEWASKVSAAAAQVKALWRNNFLNAISIGFIPHEWTRRKNDTTGEEMSGWIFSRWELLEYSIVPIPANSDALRLSLMPSLVSQKRNVILTMGDLAEFLGIPLPNTIDPLEPLSSLLTERLNDAEKDNTKLLMLLSLANASDIINLGQGDLGLHHQDKLQMKVLSAQVLRLETALKQNGIAIPSILGDEFAPEDPGIIKPNNNDDTERLASEDLEILQAAAELVTAYKQRNKG